MLAGWERGTPVPPHDQARHRSGALPAMSGPGAFGSARAGAPRSV
jgi:hypothetical protein